MGVCEELKLVDNLFLSVYISVQHSTSRFERKVFHVPKATRQCIHAEPHKCRVSAKKKPSARTLSELSLT